MSNLEIHISPARYARGKAELSIKGNTTGYKSAAHRLAEACGMRWANRSHAYIGTSTQADRVQRLFAAGWDARLVYWKDQDFSGPSDHLPEPWMKRRPGLWIAPRAPEPTAPPAQAAQAAPLPPEPAAPVAPTAPEAPAEPAALVLVRPLARSGPREGWAARGVAGMPAFLSLAARLCDALGSPAAPQTTHEAQQVLQYLMGAEVDLVSRAEYAATGGSWPEVVHEVAQGLGWDRPPCGGVGARH